MNDLGVGTKVRARYLGGTVAGVIVAPGPDPDSWVVQEDRGTTLRLFRRCELELG
jgi:hypothetical protein